MSEGTTNGLVGLQELVVDGVRVFHLPGPSKTRAALFFGVGLQDETFGTVGVTHLVEHLTMAQLPKSHLDANATVTVDHTAFYANGRPAEVGEFLRRVCAALADLPLADLEREKSVVLTESSGGADPTMAAAWAARYGFAGPGLALTDGLGPLALTGEDVRAHVAARFTAGQAALAVLGPLPDGLSLPLVAAAQVRVGAPAVVEPRLGDGPEWVEAPSPGVGLLLDGLLTDDGASRVAGTVLCLRLEDVARTRRGVTYVVSSDLVEGPDGDLFSVALDFREGMAAEVAGLVWEQLADLATTGPTQAELDHTLRGYAGELDPADVDVAEAEPFRFAIHTALHGRPRTLEELSGSVVGVTRDDVRDRLATALRRALLVLPEGSRLPEAAQRSAPITERAWCAVAAELPPGRQLRPPLLARMREKMACRQLVLTEDSIALRDETGTVHEVRWDDVVGVEVLPYADGGVEVVGRHLCGIPWHPDSYGQAAYDEVLRRTAPHVERMRRAQAAEAAQA